MASVLIVDDDQAIVRLLKILFEGNDFQVVATAFNGQSAINKFRKLSNSEKPDVIIMDHRMPIKSGIEATIEILEISTKPRIIFATADIEVKEHVLKIGAFSIVSKPFDFDKLLDAINSALHVDVIPVRSGIN